MAPPATSPAQEEEMEEEEEEEEEGEAGDAEAQKGGEELLPQRAPLLQPTCLRI